MTEPRKPIFGFLWPKPDPHAPVDGDFVQVRQVRITPRGPIRLAALVVSGLLLVSLFGSAVMAGLGAGPSVPILAMAAVCAIALVLVLRGAAVGTFVTDERVTFERVLRRAEVPWSEVVSVATTDSRTPFLGLPITVPGRWTVLHLADGSLVRTHVYSSSPDLWLRPEAFDIARLRLEHWRTP
ncbi:MAG: hypothetical protein GC156_09715 [Actinomycetales bacterium]|nr:hypothetical protein [Actinomycetales bacterium]